MHLLTQTLLSSVCVLLLLLMLQDIGLPRETESSWDNRGALLSWRRIELVHLLMQSALSSKLQLLMLLLLLISSELLMLPSKSWVVLSRC